jgi:hypothetical protein
MTAPPDDKNGNARRANPGASEAVEIGKIEPPVYASPLRQKQGRSRGGLSGQEKKYLHTREQAEALARTISAVWAAKGHRVSVWVEQSHVEGGSEFVVRSAIVQGSRL